MQQPAGGAAQDDLARAPEGGHPIPCSGRHRPELRPAVPMATQHGAGLIRVTGSVTTRVLRLASCSLGGACLSLIELPAAHAIALPPNRNDDVSPVQRTAL